MCQNGSSSWEKARVDLGRNLAYKIGDVSSARAALGAAVDRWHTGHVMSMLQMDTTPSGVTLRNVYGWPGWTIEVDLVVVEGTWRAREIRDRAPQGTRKNARRPCDDPDLIKRLTKAAEMRHGWLGFVAAALPSPHKKKTNGRQLRAATIAIMYRLAVNQGLSPRRAISEVYDLPVDDRGPRALYDARVERWIKQARTTIDPHTGKPYLEPFDEERPSPKRWPGSTGEYLMEPRRAQSMAPEPVREGEHVGRILTLRAKRTPPPAVDPEECRGRIVGPDLVVTGRWNDDGEPPPARTLLAVSPAEAPRQVLALIKEFEALYPGAKITASISHSST